MNPNLALIFLGISIGITTVLDITGVFTNCWFSDGRNCTGIVPFDSTEPAWLAATSWMLFVSVAVIVIIMATYIVVVIEFLKSGFHHPKKSSHSGHTYSPLRCSLCFLIVISFLVFLLNDGENEAGWSYWVTLSSIFAIGNVQVFAKAVQPHCIAT